MTSTPQETKQENTAHVGDLLPAYLNGTLEATARSQAQRHLAHCAACREELALWMALAAASREALAPSTVAAPSPALMEGVWARLDAPSMPEQLAGGVWRAGRLVRSQARLIPPGIWLASTLATVFCFLGFLLLGSHTHTDGAHVAALQSLIAPLVTGLCLAFIYGPEHDAGLEVALSTPTSPRKVLLARLGLVFGYNFALTTAVTLVVALVTGGSFVALASLWLGPLLLLSSLSLALSVGVSTMVAAIIAGLLWILHLFSMPNVLLIGPFGSDSGSLLSLVWQTNPFILALALALLLLALFSAPRRVPQQV